MEVDAKGAGLLFRLIGLDCWWLIADSNFIYHIETRYDIQKTKNGTKIYWTTILEALISSVWRCNQRIFKLMNTNNHFTLPASLFQLKVLISLNSVFWNTLTPLETLICHISISAIFTQFQIRLWRFLSLKPITMNDILDTTQSWYSTLIYTA